MKKEFTDLLNKYTDEANITAKALAGAIGVAESTMKKWRCYENSPRERTKVLAMAKCLNLTEEATNEFLKAAGFKPEYIFVDLPLAKSIFTEDIRGVFNNTLPRLTYPVILLLNQADWAQPPPCREALLAQARRIYSPNNVLHIWPPSSLSGNVNKYFSSLGKQCGFPKVKDDSDFQQVLENRLEDTDELFLLVSRFEQGAQSLGEQLAHILRTLSDQYAHRLHIILCGGEKLERLKYGEGELSLLDHAKDERWAEIGLSEVKALAEYRFELQLDDNRAKELLAISGGHPQLLDECLTLQQQKPTLSLADYPERLSQSQYALQGFTPFIQDESARQQVSNWLQQDDLGTFTYFINDNLLRKLYWKNLLVVRENVDGEKRLCWRCEALKMAGKKILAGQYQPSFTGEDHDDREES
jgi:transcriptional regulator with XRE-family HTH domain